MKKSTSIVLLAVLIVFSFSGCNTSAPVDIETRAPALVSAIPSAAASESAIGDPSATVTVPETTASPAASPSVSPTAGNAVGSPAAISEQTLSYQNDYIKVNIKYPAISGLADSAQQQAANNKLITTLKDDAQQAESDSKGQSAAQQFTYDANYTVERNDGRFLSIREDIEEWSGGADTDDSLVFLNYLNTNPGQILSLGGLFSTETDYNTKINNEIKAIINSDSSDGGDYTFSGVSDSTGYYLTGSALVIVFDKATIAPSVVGEPEFKIPLSDLSGMLIPELKP